MEEEVRKKIEAYICRQSGADRVHMSNMKLLPGGAIQENWAADVEITGGPQEGHLAVVLRGDAVSLVSDSHSRAQEFALLKAAFEAGVTVPEPLWVGDASVYGREFLVMRRVEGTAAGHKIVKDERLGGDREKLTECLGEELARIHTIKPPRPDLVFLVEPECHPAVLFVREERDFLDTYHTPYPGLEWGLRWLDENIPKSKEITLVHRDFRTGNYMVDESGLTGVLDWEFTTWSDPLEDIGWLCARCWRFGQGGPEREAGGIGTREALYRGYERVSGRKIDHEAVYYWEVFAHMRWAMIAIRQGERHISGKESSLELALTSHIVPELELHILRMTGVDYA
jgi:aminoglycoside phosphotransferase (APT) family kinase protein